MAPFWECLQGKQVTFPMCSVLYKHTSKVDTEAGSGSQSQEEQIFQEGKQHTHTLPGK